MFTLRHTFRAASGPAKRGFHTSMAKLAVKDIQTANEFHETVLKDKEAFVDFYATWCGPCKAISPIVEKFSDEYAGKVNFYKVDVDKFSDIAMEYGISAMPTFQYFQNGEKVLQTVGANPNSIKTMLKRGLDE